MRLSEIPANLYLLQTLADRAGMARDAALSPRNSPLHALAKAKRSDEPFG